MLLYVQARTIDNTNPVFVSGPKRDEVTRELRSYIVRSFIMCSHPQISSDRSNLGERGR
jgi:hypothetical protein